jgi:glutaredoxin
VASEPLVTIYSRPGCHLCDAMKTVVDQVRSKRSFALEVIDISSDPELEARYGLEIPVLVVNGRKAAKYRVTEAELERLLDGRASG